jgi:hypothetical protein
MARRAAVVLKAMKSNWCGAGMKVELDGYAGVAEARGVGEVFVAEHVELGDLDVGGRQPSTSRRRGPRRAPAPDGLRLVCAVRSVNQVRRVGMAHHLRAGEYPGMFLTRIVDGVSSRSCHSPWRWPQSKSSDCCFACRQKRSGAAARLVPAEKRHDDADICIAKRASAQVAERIEEFRDAHHDAVLPAHFALHRVEIWP